MIGDFGESWASAFLMKETSQGHLFRVKYVDGKWPTIDMYAEVLGEGGVHGFCFFQIKTTDRGFTRRERKLKVEVDQVQLDRLANFAAPTYLIGISHNSTDPMASQAYILAIRGKVKGKLKGMTTKFPLNDDTLIALKREIVEYWNTLDPLASKASYVTNFEA